MMKRNGLKFMFATIDDIWLYNLHQQQYDGRIQEILGIIQFVEEEKWKIIELDSPIEEIKSSNKRMKDYNLHSNPTHLRKQRRNSVFIKL